MRQVLAQIAALFLLTSVCWSEVVSDEQIKRVIIQESISAYQGSCPCPYSTDRAGRVCGKRSAWSRAGGDAPLCYESDVTDEMVKQFRKRLRE
jgi:hypothetical protein